jgi:hypothetical protein
MKLHIENLNNNSTLSDTVNLGRYVYNYELKPTAVDDFSNSYYLSYSGSIYVCWTDDVNANTMSIVKEHQNTLPAILNFVIDKEDVLGNWKIYLEDKVFNFVAEIYFDKDFNRDFVGIRGLMNSLINRYIEYWLDLPKNEEYKVII